MMKIIIIFLLIMENDTLVAAAKQCVVLGRHLATKTHLSRLQRLQGVEGDTKALGSHRRGPGLQVLVPDEMNRQFQISLPIFYLITKSRDCWLLSGTKLTIQLPTVMFSKATYIHAPQCN